MKKNLLLPLFFVLSSLAYGQNFKYEFVLEGVNNPGDAKYAITEIRELLGVKTMKFHDDTNTFEILTHLEWEVEEMIYDLESIGLTLVGIIEKTNLE